VGVNENSYEILENGAGKFKIDIAGAATASANVESITVEDLVIDEREMTTGSDWDYRVFGPGDAHFGSITIRSRVGKESKELYQWWLDCSQGKNIRKAISVIALKRDGSEARRWNVFEAFPTRWDPGEYSPSSNVACETIVAKMQRVELG
jgi:phage tail-like protein